MADEGLGSGWPLALSARAEDAVEEIYGTQTATGSGLATCFSGCGEQPRQREILPTLGYLLHTATGLSLDAV